MLSYKPFRMSLPYYVDPIYPCKQISIDKEWLRTVMNHPMFQRLKDIGQTSCADYLFIAHRHSRYEHSLGTGYLAKRVCAGFDIDNSLKDKLVFASICHDLGHGPFSHSLEYFVLPKLGIHDFCHEAYSVEIANKIYDTIPDPGFDIDNLGEILNNGGRNLDNEVFNLVSNKSFGVDVDRADYMVRDSYLLGIDLGLELDKLFGGFVLEKAANGKSFVLALRADVVPLFHHFIRMRYLMFEHLYTQPLTTGRNLLVARLLCEADPYLKLSTRVKTLTEFVGLTDHILQEALKLKNKNDRLDKTIKLVEYNQAYHFCVEFEMKDEQIKNQTSKFMHEYTETLKDKILGPEFAQKEDVEVYFAKIDSFKDTDYDNIAIKHNGQLLKLPEYLERAELEPLERRVFRRFRVFALTEDLVDSVLDKFKQFEKAHEDQIINVNYDPMIYDLYRALGK